MTHKLVVVACEGFAPEIDAALASSGARGVERRSFTCRCASAPLHWSDVLGERPFEPDAETQVFGSRCLARLIREGSPPPRVRLHRLHDCHELIAPRATLEAITARGGYLVTSAWLEHWERHLESFGVTDDASRAMFTEGCRTIVLLDPGVDAPPLERLEGFARAVSLPWEVVVVGNELLEQRIELLTLRRELDEAREAAAGTFSRALQPAAEYAMALDVFASLSDATTESDVVQGLFALFDNLMAPAAMCWVPIVDGQPGAPVFNTTERFALPLPEGPYDLSHCGFAICFAVGQLRAGVMHIHGLSRPENRERYLNLALNLSLVCGITLEKARQREQLLATKHALSQEKDRLSTTLRSIADGVIATDAAGCVVLLNDVAEKLTGWTQREAVGRLWSQVLRIVYDNGATTEDTVVQRVLSTRKSQTLRAGGRLVNVDGSSRAIADSAAPIVDAQGDVTGVVIVLRDVTEAERIEREMQRIERLDSLGVFAGGLAHDFNNLLGALLTNLSMADDAAEPGSILAARLQGAIRVTERASGLTQQLLTFAKGGTPMKASTSIEAVVRDGSSLPLHGTSVRAEFEIQPGIWPVQGDPGQLAQVVQNLVINAVQAMPHGGVVTIRARNVEPSDVDRLPLAARRYVQMSVSDQGTGITSDLLARIFDPFFTTKAKGNGLGLAVVHSIVRRHDGLIEVQSEPGAGATFEVYLPAAARPLAAPVAPTERVIRGAGKVLVMDDEPDVLEATVLALTHLGYRVVSTDDGDECIAAYGAAIEQSEKFDLVVLDMTIPGGKGGIETIDALRKLDPAVRAVAVTGYSNAPVVADPGRYGFVGALAKPFSLSALSKLVGQHAPN